MNEQTQYISAYGALAKLISLAEDKSLSREERFDARIEFLEMLIKINFEDGRLAEQQEAESRGYSRGINDGYATGYEDALLNMSMRKE